MLIRLAGLAGPDTEKKKKKRAMESETEKVAHHSLNLFARMWKWGCAPRHYGLLNRAAKLAFPSLPGLLLPTDHKAHPAESGAESPPLGAPGCSGRPAL